MHVRHSATRCHEPSICHFRLASSNVPYFVLRNIHPIASGSPSRHRTSHTQILHCHPPGIFPCNCPHQGDGCPLQHIYPSCSTSSLSIPLSIQKAMPCSSSLKHSHCANHIAWLHPPTIQKPQCMNALCCGEGCRYRGLLGNLHRSTHHLSHASQ